MKKINSHLLVRFAYKYLLLVGGALVITTTCTDVVDKPLPKVSIVALGIAEASGTTIDVLERVPLQITLTYTPQNATIKSAKYSTGSQGVFSVSTAGLITPIRIGEDTLYVRAADGSGVRATYMVNVVYNPIKVTAINVTDEGKNITLTTLSAATFNLAACVSVAPNNAADKTLTYTSSNTSIVDVTSAGVVSHKNANGTAVITIAANDGSGVSNTANVTVNSEAIPVSSITTTLPQDSVAVKTSATYDLAAALTILPSNATNQTLSYTSNDETIAAVDASGVVTGVSAGVTTITVAATDANAVSKTVKVMVYEKIIVKTDIDRTAWTVSTITNYSGTTSLGYCQDGTTAGTGKPENMFDGLSTTYVNLLKPTRQSFACGQGSVSAAPSGAPTTQPQLKDFLDAMDEGMYTGFVVDLQEAKPFNYIKWQHRSSNNTVYLRVFGVRIYGSNDGTAFTLIENSVDIPSIVPTSGDGMADPTLYNIDISSSTYRYVKVLITTWAQNLQRTGFPNAPYGSGSGGGLQIAEFGLGMAVEE
jgi:uncharacterized protein YjdB